MQRRFGLGLGLAGAPVALLLVLQVGLFVATAWRGLDLTDESYYLLSYQHWRGLIATVTFFGAYFDGPFRLLGADVGAMRVLGMALLVVAGGFFTRQALAFGRDAAEPVPWPYTAAGMAGAMFYYSYVTTLRAPSYNLLVLFCMLVSSGLLFVLADGRGARWRLGCTAFAYGLLIGACGLTKATSALATVLCHLVFLSCFARVRRLPEWAWLAALGVGVNLLALHLAQPHWLDALLTGVQLTAAMDSHPAAVPFETLRRAVVRGAVRLLPALVLAVLVFWFAAKRWGRTHRSVLSSLVVLTVAGIMLTIQQQGYGKSWWVLLVFGTALLWLAERLCRDSPMPRWRDVRGVTGVSVLLFVLPICYSVGTNGSLPAHTQMAAVFAIVALMLPLRRLHALGLVHGGAVMAVLSLLCVPMLVSELRALDDPVFTYRLRTGLLDQRFGLELGDRRRTLHLDAITRDSLHRLQLRMRELGYQPGQPVLDATGDGPGLVYALGGRPLGVAWIIGGYPGSERAAARVLDAVAPAELRRAWVLVADDSPRALRTLPQMVAQRTGGPGPQPVASLRVVAQYRWDGLPPEPVELTVWRPALGGVDTAGVAPR